MKKILIFLAVIISITPGIFSQDDEEDVYNLVKEAVELTDRDKLNEALKLLKEAYTIDPNSMVVNYEMAYVYYKKKDYQKVVNILEKFVTHKDRSDIVFKLLGNAYDMVGNRDKAIETYNKGLAEFPYSGPLYLELGVVAAMSGDMKEAMQQFEFGIRFDPKHSSNYYHAARILLSSGNMWGLIYGEMFLYLEKFTERWKEVSALMYNFYKNQVLKNDSSTTINIDFPIDTARQFEMKYMTGNMLGLLVLAKDGVSIKSISELRNYFIQVWFEKGENKEFPNALFDFQKILYDEGLMEANTYLIFSLGNTDECTKYFKENKKKIDKLDSFYKKYKSNLITGNPVYRGMYK
jgi:Tfp pilus assembly protein PilF